MATMASKRKRDSHDMHGMRPPPAMGMGMSSDFDTQYFQMEAGDTADHNMDFAAVLAQHNADPNAIDDEPDEREEPQSHQQSQTQTGNVGQSASDTAAAAMAQYHTMTVPQTTEQSFMQQTQQQQQSESGERQASSSVDPQTAQQRTSSFTDFDVNSAMKESQTSQNGGQQGSPTAASPTNPNAPKPTVGSDEWHKVRRDNHKEVERRRRETINEGINELAKIVPGCEKNKGSILSRAVQFITQLKENETQNIEKWTLEKLLTEQAIAELSSSCDKLKAECQRAWAECEQWKKAAQKAGVTLENEESKVDADGDDAD